MADDRDGTKELPEYSREDIVYKSLIVFGQGTGCMRLSTEASNHAAARLYTLLQNRDVLRYWHRDAVQFLERVRTIGKVARLRALGEARTYIDREDVEVAVRRVSAASKTAACGDGGEEGGGRKPGY